MTMRIRNLIRWFIPLGYAVRLIRKYEYGRVNLKNSLINYKGVEIPLYSAYETPFYGVYLVYSKENYNKSINKKINDLRKDIEGLEGCLK